MCRVLKTVSCNVSFRILILCFCSRICSFRILILDFCSRIRSFRILVLGFRSQICILNLNPWFCVRILSFQILDISFCSLICLFRILILGFCSRIRSFQILIPGFCSRICWGAIVPLLKYYSQYCRTMKAAERGQLFTYSLLLTYSPAIQPEPLSHFLFSCYL